MEDIRFGFAADDHSAPFSMDTMLNSTPNHIHIDNRPVEDRMAERFAGLEGSEVEFGYSGKHWVHVTRRFFEGGEPEYDYKIIHNCLGCEKHDFRSLIDQNYAIYIPEYCQVPWELETYGAETFFDGLEPGMYEIEPYSDRDYYGEVEGGLRLVGDPR